MSTKRIKHTVVKLLPEIILFIPLLVFSFWLMFHTLSYENGSFYIASKAWSDFASHLPLIRSFSLGSNFPPQYPMFPGEAIHYHFVFYAFVGLLERLGVQFDYALNIPSALGFFALLVAIYAFSWYLFRSRAVSILSTLFFLFNGSLSFLYFFQKNPFSKNTISDITNLTTFPSFGPYDGNMVSAFWNLNIFTNQRHFAAALAFSYIVVLLFIFINRKTKPLTYPFLISIPKKIRHQKKVLIHHIREIFQTLPFVYLFLLGIVLGFSFYFHLVAFVMTAFVIGMLALFFANLRISAFIVLITAIVIALPQYLYLNSSSSGFSLITKIGFLVEPPVTISSFITYWFYNLGIHLILIPIGLVLAPRRAQKIFLCVLPIFVIGNVFQFSPEIAANHKFFNYFAIVAEMFSAFALVWLWKKKVFTRPIVIITTIILLLSGIIDFFPVYNDGKMELSDYPKNPTIEWIRTNTPPDSVFLNTSFLNDPASLAGRKIFMGWPYFAWSGGHDTNERNKLLQSVLTANSVPDVCKITKPNNLSYLGVNLLNENDSNFPKLSPIFESNFPVLYTSREYVIYDLKLCNQ